VKTEDFRLAILRQQPVNIMARQTRPKVSVNEQNIELTVNSPVTASKPTWTVCSKFVG